VRSSETAKKVLLTGAAGRIGTAFYTSARERYWFRLADRRTESLGDAAADGHEAMALDVADLLACQEACRGIDTVVHLAADPSPQADFYESLLENNIKGTYNVFRAAKDQGCRRVIFASSVHAVAGYPADVPVSPRGPVRPTNMYGVSKCFGEAVASCFAYSEGLSAIAIRIGAYDSAWIRQRASVDDLTAYLSVRDMNHLLVRCIEAEDVRFAIVHGISNNHFKRMDLSETKELLGYEPADDAFRLFDSGLKFEQTGFQRPADTA
jgi:NAD(P)-dependent dehydrogenase (short-subunit alcohol dehydrogenase family)